ncbi:MAG TPA: aromatic amino acid ammonia-lyase [Propionicimonas sp.]|nr:aromatic amino acid ammonia-lyase [Propionicimonas sp.]
MNSFADPADRAANPMRLVEPVETDPTPRADSSANPARLVEPVETDPGRPVGPFPADSEPALGRWAAPSCPTTGGRMNQPARVVSIGSELTPEDIADVAIGHASVALDAAVLRRLADARAHVDDALATGVPTYGLNRGLGPLRNSEIPAELMADFQRFVLVSHAAAIGDPLSRTEGRAALLARLNTLASGASGASEALFTGLFELLARDVVPVIPDQGSVGAGDLSQLAAIGQVLIGSGRAWLPGRDEIVPGAVALAAAGLAPVQLAAKDSLALVGSNALSVASAALIQRRATLLAEGADLVAALTVEALGANLSPFDARALAARPHPGQQASGRRIRAALAEGDLARGLRPSASLQDAVSLRTVPQVHGALLDELDELERILVVELNCVPDNPFLDAEAGVFIPNGNFSITNLAIRFDALRIGLAHVAKMAERRVALLVRELRQGLSLVDQVQAVTSATGYVTPVILAQTASALVAQAKHVAAPISLTGTTVGDGIEDHSSMAYPSVRASDTSLDVVERLLAVEALLAASVLSVHQERQPAELGRPVERLRTAIIEVTGRTQVTAEVIEWVIEALRRERRGDNLSEMRAPVYRAPVANHDQEVLRHDQLH